MHNAIAKIAANQIRNYMARHGIKQRELAMEAGVSQATVSRALKGKALRHGTARDNLFTYVGINESDIDTARSRVMSAFEGIWDLSEKHADAVARVIKALGEFGSPTKTR